VKIGSLVKGIFTGEIWVVTKVTNNDYVIINNRWIVPIDHLEVICE
jgi:hypothetical protein